MSHFDKLHSRSQICSWQCLSFSSIDWHNQLSLGTLLCMFADTISFGQMIFPWMFDEIAALRPLKEVANILAEKADWPPLYNKQLLNANKVCICNCPFFVCVVVIGPEWMKNCIISSLHHVKHVGVLLLSELPLLVQVPVAAAVYYEDLYVDFSLAQATAAQISGIRLWVTNEYMHSGLREDGSRILDQLFGMIKGKFPLR